MSEKEQLLEEIRELELEILDMFEVAFYFAGLDSKHLQEAIEYYEEIMESITEDSEYNAKDIIKIIETIKIDKPQWFKI
ncbi:hypothetical protein DCO58_12405 [Helicobacter saguini]|uniref:Uncharacterized protein n=1 Tax=Helicobacter saguini TaxID=1548018 RepID=A0A347VQK9_9HELI|nr:hypothetical protein [Helicobacter saguini]MWV60908.1 hypothetical protein [Helicobacter saguini]MWV68424.1 hypothetical protein [Helicobacter saguini]MWV70112.1 hypothetical protein [Helicobacter saguini]MWV72015.1 hypothetical protein [Helicobacter saguini]TLD93761.1 hypothetical protein LS64_008180 [Helicobacter saguini]